MSRSDFDISYLTRVQSDANTPGGTLASGADGSTVKHEVLTPPVFTGSGDHCRAYAFAPEASEDSVNQVKLLVADVVSSLSSEAPYRLVNPAHNKAVSLRLAVRLDRGDDADAADSADNALAMVGLTAFTSATAFSGGYELVLQAKGAGASRTVQLALRTRPAADFSAGHASMGLGSEVACSGSYALGQWYLIRLDVIPAGVHQKKLIAYTSSDNGASWTQVGSTSVSALDAGWRQGSVDPNRNGIIVLRSSAAGSSESYKQYFTGFDARIESVDVNTTPSVGTFPEVAMLTNTSISIPMDKVIGGKDADEFLFYSATLANGSPLPAWLSIDSKTGIFLGTPPVGQDGQLSLNVTVEDERGASGSNNVALTIQPEASAPSNTVLQTSGIVKEATANALVGELDSTDPLGGAVTHSILTGIDDAAYVSVQGNQLLVAQDLPAEKESLSFWLRTENASGFYTQKQVKVPLAPQPSDESALLSGSADYQTLVNNSALNERLFGNVFSNISVLTLGAPSAALVEDISGGQNVTTNPEYTVSAPVAGAYLEYSLDNATWTTTKPDLQEGANTVYVRQRNALGASPVTTFEATITTVPPVVTDGLQLHLDAGDTNSYSGTGTTWYDLSGNGNNATLLNGVSYSSANGGYFIFDGVDDLATTDIQLQAPSNSNLQTLTAWVIGTTNQFVFGSDASNTGEFHTYVKLDGNTISFFISYYGIENEPEASATVSPNPIANHITLSKVSTNYYNVYLNGEKVLQNVYRNATTNTHLNLGRPYVAPWNTNKTVSISQMMVYNRALLDEEVLQNFNATKERFFGVVTDGLQLHLDAGDTNSYSGTGTTWYDLSGNGNNATLQNGVAYSSANEGLLTFDGVDDYISTEMNPNLDNNRLYTYELWFKDDGAGVTDGAVTNLISNYGFSNTVPFSGLFIRNNGTCFFVERNSANTESYTSDTPSIVDGTWKHLVAVSYENKLSIFINGVLNVETTSRPGGQITSGQNLLIGSGHSNRYQSCDIASVRLYLDKALSQEEVLQNFNATKERFFGVVTDGLQLHLDAGDTNSYPGSGTTWYDLSGNGNNATLLNGVGYSSANGGSLTFDGSNDYCSISQVPQIAGNEVSFCCWVYGEVAKYNSVIQLRDSSNQRILNVSLPWIDGIVYWDAGQGSGYDRIYKSVSASEYQGWHYWVFTKNVNDETMKIFLDGVLWHSEGGKTRPIESPTGYRAIGKGEYAYQGKIASTLLYNRVLSEEEVLQNFNATKSRFGL